MSVLVLIHCGHFIAHHLSSSQRSLCLCLFIKCGWLLRGHLRIVHGGLGLAICRSGLGLGLGLFLNLLLRSRRRGVKDGVDFSLEERLLDIQFFEGAGGIFVFGTRLHF